MINPKTISYFYFKIRFKTTIVSISGVFRKIDPYFEEDFSGFTPYLNSQELSCIGEYINFNSCNVALKNVMCYLYYPKEFFKNVSKDIFQLNYKVHKYICQITFDPLPDFITFGLFEKYRA